TTDEVQAQRLVVWARNRRLSTVPAAVRRLIYDRRGLRRCLQEVVDTQAPTHRSTPLPLRDRFTITEAIRLTISVNVKSTKPSINRLAVPTLPPAPKLFAMYAATELPPCSRMCVDVVSVPPRMIKTAIVSPSARP